MKVLINGVMYDSTKTPILLVFDTEEEKETFGLNRYVSAPPESTVEERQKLIDTNLEQHTWVKTYQKEPFQRNDRPYSKVENPCFVCEVEDKLGESRGTQSHPINCGWRLKRERNGYIDGLRKIVGLCDPKIDTDPEDIIRKIKEVAISTYAFRYDIEKIRNGPKPTLNIPISKIVYHFNKEILFEEHLVFSRIWLVDQSMIYSGNDYVVKAVNINDGIQNVYLV